MRRHAPGEATGKLRERAREMEDGLEAGARRDLLERQFAIGDQLLRAIDPILGEVATRRPAEHFLHLCPQMPFAHAQDFRHPLYRQWLRVMLVKARTARRVMASVTESAARSAAPGLSKSLRGPRGSA